MLHVEHLGDDATGLSQWRDYVASNRDSTVYHSPAWRTIFERSFGYRAWLLMARDDGSGAIRGVLPLYLVATPFSRRLVSVPFRDRGGPLWDTADAFHLLVAEAKKIADKHRAGSIELKAIAPYPRELASRAGLSERSYWVRSAIDLERRSIEDFWRDIGPKTRNMIRQAENEGLAFDDRTDAPGCLEDWYLLHLLSQKHLGLPPFPRVFFETMFNELGRELSCAVLQVRNTDRPVAASVLLLHKRCAIYGYSASNPALRQYRPNDLMLYSTIKWLLRSGRSLFDLGSDAPGQEGLLFFKRKWLAVQNAIPSYSLGGSDRSLTDSSSARYALARKIFSLLPLPVLNFAGRAVTKYFG